MKTFMISIFLTIVLFSNSCISSKNKIYTKGRVWHYNSTFFDSNNVILLNEKLILKRPGGNFNGQTKIEWKYPQMNTSNGSKLIKLYNPSKIDINLFNEISTNTTGAIEEYDISGPKSTKVNRVWIHPPRGGYYIATELCPFPTAVYNIDTNQAWNDKISGLNGFGDWDGITIKSSFKNSGKKEFQNQSCHLIKATSQSKIGSCKVIYHFNELNGFIKMEYIFHDGNKLVLELDSLTN